jgi:hypothetical protein
VLREWSGDYRVLFEWLMSFCAAVSFVWLGSRNKREGGVRGVLL